MAILHLLRRTVGTALWRRGRDYSALRTETSGVDSGRDVRGRTVLAIWVRERVRAGVSVQWRRAILVHGR